ncbi:hypothetical protein [Clostridium perfringens]|uniref:hypothetical protein n=1 Tax=Clostridium perfringens TaxID=1502 RepID=UPI00374E37E9
MIDVFIKPLINITDIIFKHSDLSPKQRKSSKAILQIYWTLDEMEMYSQHFLEGLEIISKEKRIPSRMSIILNQLQKNINKMHKMFSKDKFGFKAQSWCIWNIYGDISEREFKELLGIKLHRLNKWNNILTTIRNSLEIDYDNPNTSLKYNIYDLDENENLVLYNIFDDEYLKREIQNTKEVIIQLQNIRTKLKTFIKEKYDQDAFFA